ncbi:unnamed protein product [Closterium sp. NIES-53]
MLPGTCTLTPTPNPATHPTPHVLSAAEAISNKIRPCSAISARPIRISHARRSLSQSSLAVTPSTSRLVERPAGNDCRFRRSFLGNAGALRCKGSSANGPSVRRPSVSATSADRITRPSVIATSAGRTIHVIATAAAAAAVVTGGIMAAPAAAGTAGAGAAAAAAAAAASSSSAEGALLAACGVNTSVLRASLGAAFKLFAMCAFIVWLMKANILPEATPSVLSQVAFQALIPCFLMTKVASTLAVQPLTSLAALPFLAVIQILCGAALGKLACTIAYRRPSSLSSLPSPPAARHIAFSVAQSLGLSPSAVALLSGLPPPKREGAVEGKVGGGKAAPGRGVLSAPGMVGAAERAAGRKEAVVMSACAFGNSLTLPLVFLATLLTRADADRAAGYLALFMVG